MRVTPGSWTLWSVHSGQRRWTSRLASSTKSWNLRSSRSGAGSAIASVLLGDGVEGDDEVAPVVGAAHDVRHVDQRQAGTVRVEGHLDVLDVDPRLPAEQRG